MVENIFNRKAEKITTFFNVISFLRVIIINKYK